VRPSLQRRLLLLALGATAAVWIATIAFTWFDARHEIDELLDAHLAQAAALLIVQTAGEIEEVDVEHAPMLHRQARKVAFQVWESGRTLRVHSVNAPNEPLGTREEGFGDQVVEGQRWRVFTAWNAERDMLIHVGERSRVREELASDSRCRRSASCCGWRFAAGCTRCSRCGERSRSALPTTWCPSTAAMRRARCGP
jgi:two-component system sensor histidine kinase QseC